MYFETFFLSFCSIWRATKRFAHKFQCQPNRVRKHISYYMHMVILYILYIIMYTLRNLGDQSADASGEEAHLFNQYFHSVFTASDYILPPFESIATTPVTLSDIVISEDEVYHALITLDPSKAMGLDGIGPRVLRACALALHPVLHHLFYLRLTQRRFPMDWKLHKIVAVFKSTDKSSYFELLTYFSSKCYTKSF